MRHKKLIAGAVGIIVIGVAITAYLLFMPKTAESPSVAPQPSEPAAEPEPQSTKEPPTPPELLNAQPVIDEWAKNRRGRYSVVVYDLENEKTIGGANKNEVYFAASLYKLYVAYEGYLAVQRGDYNLNDPFLGEYTVEDCLDKMIRESHSPCAEKMWVELGKEELNQKLQTYGLKNTSMTNIVTSAQDATLQLARLWNNQELKSEYKDLLFNSMKKQIYRDALAKSFDSKATFYDKVGFRDYDEYHDVGILSLPNGRHYVVSVLTDEVGTTGIRDLGDALISFLNKKEQS